MQNGGSIKYIECEGSPRTMGRQYGEAAAAEIKLELELRGTLVTKDTATRIMRIIRNFAPAVLAELEGVAEAAGVDLAQLVLLNQMDTGGDEVDRCTPMILRNAPEGVIVAKNNDGPPHEHNPFIIRKCRPLAGMPFIHVTYAGWLCGMDAINEAGLANTHGSVGSKFEQAGERIDIRLYTYHLMQSCQNVTEFIRRLSQVPLAGKGYSIAVGDAEGCSAILDAAVPFIAVRDRNKGFAYSTNLYMSPGLQDADMRPADKRHICVFRNGYLRWIEAERPPLNLADMQNLLRSHEPWGPCRHGGAHVSKTNWSMINLPQYRKILLAEGNPCQTEYKEFKI